MTNKNELQGRYGHLLDKYVDGTPVNYQTNKERETEARGKYGNLLDYAKAKS